MTPLYPHPTPGWPFPTFKPTPYKPPRPPRAPRTTPDAPAAPF